MLARHSCLEATACPRLATTLLMTLFSLFANHHSATAQDSIAARYFQPPVRLEADGQPINIGQFCHLAHAGPCIADVDCAAFKT